MAKVVFLLGAGASKDAGAPLMADFLDRAWTLSAQAKDRDAEAFRTVFDGIRALQLTHSKSRLDLRNLERVFAAFDMGRLFRRLEGVKDPEALVPAMKRVIVHTLEQSMRYTFVAAGQLNAQPSYAAFVRVLKQLLRQGRSCAVITFNYDIGLDHALETHEVPLTYCLESMQPPSDRVPLLKLHGSLNWAACPTCSGQVVSWPVQAWAKQQVFHQTLKEVPVTIGTDLPRFEHGTQPHPLQPTTEPLLVPPTWNKGNQYEALRLVWSRAAQELAEAEHLVIVGYSWPRTDEFFHHLYAIGTAGPTLLRRVLLIDPSERTAVRYRRRLLGEQARQRFKHATLHGEPAVFGQFEVVMKSIFRW